MSTPANPLALEAAGCLAALMTDTADRAMVSHLIQARREGGEMPAFSTLPPLAQVAWRILDGDGTDEGARYWLRMGQAAPDTHGEDGWIPCHTDAWHNENG